jgi:hypothetical protein
MNPGGEPRESAYSPARLPRQATAHAAGRSWAKVKQGLRQSIFWAYERGSWQYDVMVLVILAFIFLTPASWFHDRPRLQLSDLHHVQGIVQLSHKKNLWTFQVDARLVQTEGKPNLQSVLQDVLKSRLRRPFTVRSVIPVKDRTGVILGYDVSLQTR